jgi:hypothetical protein
VSDEELYVILGCFGRRDEDFISCSGLENRILKVDITLEGYNKLMDYFEGCRLFDRPMFDINAVRNFIFYIQRNYYKGIRPIWSEKQFNLYQKFVIDHRICGNYIKLALINKNYDDGKLETPEEEVLIPGGNRIIKTTNPQPVIPNPRFRIVR